MAQKVLFSKMRDQFNLQSTAKFNGTNFQVWKYQILRVLKYTQLQKITFGTNMRPSTNQSNAQDKWGKLDAKAAVILSSSMTKEQMLNYLSCDTAY